MKIGTKIQMDNGKLGVQQGLIIKDDGWNGIVRWDTIEVDDDEELGDNFDYFDGKILPKDYSFKYINDDGSRKI